jgi:hypothetical protein
MFFIFVSFSFSFSFPFYLFDLYVCMRFCMSISRWRTVTKEWNYTRHAEADLAASRETIEELLVVNSRHAERAKLAAATQPAASPVRGGAVPSRSTSMRWPPVSRRAQVSTAALSSDDSDDEVAFSRHRTGVDGDTRD